MIETTFDEKSLLWSGPKICKTNAITLGEALLKSLKRYATKVTQISDNNGIHMTSNEIRQKAIRTAKNLTKMGITKTDVIGFYCKNSHNVASVVFGSIFIGAAINPLNTAIDDKNEIARVFGKTKPSIIFADEDNVETVKLGLLQLDISVRIFVFGDSGNGYSSVNDLFVETDDDNEEDFCVTHIDNPDTHIGMMLCSSGTSGPPKCSVHSSNATILNDNDINDTFTFNIALTFTNIGVVSGLNSLIATTICGMQRIITTEPFSPLLFMKLIEKYKVTLTYRPPLHITSILKHPNLHQADFSTLKTFTSGSGMVYEYLCNELDKYLPNGNVLIKYGMTEVFGGISFNDPKLRPNSVGKLVAGLSVKIIDKSGKRCGVNENGEICYKSDHILLRYQCDDEATRNVIDLEGFVRSGDFGHFNADGYLYLIDRQINLIANGDHFVSAIDIENVILQLVGVANVAVVGVKNCSNKIVPAAAVIKCENDSVTEQEICDFVKEKLSDEHTLSGGVYFLKSFPLNQSLTKVNKNELRQIIAELYRLSNL